MNRQPEYHFFHFAGKSKPTPNKPQPVVKPKSYNDKFQVIGGKREQFDWTKNGLPLAIMHRVDNGDNGNVQVGAKVRFDAGWDRGTIDYYQDNSATVGINYSGYGMIWYDSDFAYNM